MSILNFLGIKEKIKIDIANVYFEFLRNKWENKIRHCQCPFRII